jgi:hypothetical protein
MVVRGEVGTGGGLKGRAESWIVVGLPTGTTFTRSVLSSTLVTVMSTVRLVRSGMSSTNMKPPFRGITPHVLFIGKKIGY